jgi:hypothetical protein
MKHYINLIVYRYAEKGTTTTTTTPITITITITISKDK